MDRLREAVMMVDIVMGVMEVEEGTVDVAEGEVVDLEAEEEVSEGHGNFKSTAFRCILSLAFTEDFIANLYYVCTSIISIL